MIGIDVEIDDREVRAALDRLRRRADDLSPVMREIAGHIEDSAAESFERQAAPPDGQAWNPLAEATVHERTDKGYGPEGPILERTGDLASRILSDFDDDSAVAGTNLVYAATHQFGSGDDGRNIPARPFLGLWPEHRDAILDRLGRRSRPALPRVSAQPLFARIDPGRPHFAFGKKSCRPAIRWPAMAAWPASDRSQSMKAWPSAAFTWPNLSGSTRITPYWLKRSSSPST